VIISSITSSLSEGDALNPTSTDVIVQKGYLRVGKPVPTGWRVLTGNQYDSAVYRVAYRYEIEEEKP
jgi:hypothetical protein